MRSQLPGNDGGRRVRRAVKKTWAPTLTQEEKEAFRPCLWDVFKYVECGDTQRQVERTLTIRFPCADSIRSNMPTTFEQFFDACEQLGFFVTGYTYDYDICPCGFVYR